MEKNNLTLSIEFYFKGKQFNPSLTIDLNKVMSISGCFANFYSLIATNNNIDLYSYEYEMMQAEELKATNAEGLVASYVKHGKLNIVEFEEAWNQQKIVLAMNDIAKCHMNIDVLNDHPNLKEALLSAYKLGQS